MKVGVSSTLTVFHDGQFWVGVVERLDHGAYSVCRLVFGAEPSNEELLAFVVRGWEKLEFSTASGGDAARKKPASNPKRRQREASEALRQRGPSTKAQAALAAAREEFKERDTRARKESLDADKRARFERKVQKRKRKRRGH